VRILPCSLFRVLLLFNVRSNVDFRLLPQTIQRRIHRSIGPLLKHTSRADVRGYSKEVSCHGGDTTTRISNEGLEKTIWYAGLHTRVIDSTDWNLTGAYRENSYSSGQTVGTSSTTVPAFAPGSSAGTIGPAFDVEIRVTRPNDPNLDQYLLRRISYFSSPVSPCCSITWQWKW